jgi:hypothetical protein
MGHSLPITGSLWHRGKLDQMDVTADALGPLRRPRDDAGASKARG